MASSTGISSGREIKSVVMIPPAVSSRYFNKPRISSASSSIKDRSSLVSSGGSSLSKSVASSTAISLRMADALCPVSSLIKDTRSNSSISCIIKAASSSESSSKSSFFCASVSSSTRSTRSLGCKPSFTWRSIFSKVCWIDTLLTPQGSYPFPEKTRFIIAYSYKGYKFL